jgi:RNA polymerase sigma-70 factor (ECF subfamily)
VTHEEKLLGMLETHGAALRRIARAYAGAAGEEDDLYQEILLQLWRGLPSFRGDAAPGTWLYRVALNTALTWRRRATRRDRASAEPVEPAAPSASDARNEAAILEEFLASRTAVDRSVLLLYMEGLQYQEIADVTGLTAGAVGLRLHRMKHAFTEQYVEQ